MLRATSIHTYMGGMEIGVSNADINVIASAETWDKAVESRIHTEPYVNKAVTPESLQDHRVDLVFANPPCSRYSLSAQAKYAKSAKACVAEFCEMGEIVQAVRDTGARMMWWETGPLCWTTGREMIAAIDAELKEIWGSCQSLIVRLDLRYLGVPQRRPRCHVIHSATKHEPQVTVANSEWPSNERLGPWTDRQLEGWGVEPKTEMRHPARFTGESPSKAADRIASWTTFGQSKPQLIGDLDRYIFAVMGGRWAVWVDRDRWMSLEEWAAFMCIPPQMAIQLAAQIGPERTLTMMSKGVSPSASQFIAETFVQPWIDERASETPSSKVKLWHEDGKWECDLSTSDTPRRRAPREGALR